LSIDWDYNVAGTYPLDEYEETRPPRRERLGMCVPSAIREDILTKHSDVTKKEIKEVTEEIKVARFRRNMSVVTHELDDYRLLGELIVRRLRRWRTGISKKREQELLWENAQRYMEAKSVDFASTEDTEELTLPSSASSVTDSDDMETSNE
jgi:hypothetical protein